MLMASPWLVAKEKTVGVAGGYVLGGGHSPQGSVYGLAADQVLAMEVVLPNGVFTSVTASSNPDLFRLFVVAGGLYLWHCYLCRCQSSSQRSI